MGYYERIVAIVLILNCIVSVFYLFFGLLFSGKDKKEHKKADRAGVALRFVFLNSDLGFDKFKFSHLVPSLYLMLNLKYSF